MANPARPSNNPASSPRHQAESRDWRGIFRRTLFWVFGISLGIHLLLLMVFGGATIFRGSSPKPAFISEQIDPGAVPEEVPPPPENAPEVDLQNEPVWAEAAKEPAREESAPPLEMVTVLGGANWAAALPPNVQASETGILGGTGQGTGTGSQGGGGGGPLAPLAEAKLFGVPVRAKKLGVIADISRSMQRYLPKISDEIFRKFPEADVVFVNGGGIMEWEEALKRFNQEVADEKDQAKKAGRSYMGPSRLEKPNLARFNSSEAQDWVPIRGAKINHDDYRGFREDFPELYEKMRKRANTWVVTSYAAAYATHLAIDHLQKRQNEALYWFSDFGDPIDGDEAEKTFAKLKANKIELILHSPRGMGSAKGQVNIGPWAHQVGAKFVPTGL